MIGRLSFHKRFVSLFMDLTSDIHKYFRDLRKKKKVLPKMQPDDKEPTRDTIELLFCSCYSEKKKGDISVSAIDKFLQITEWGRTACCSTDEPSESPSPYPSSPTAVTVTETPFNPSDISCSSRELPRSSGEDLLTFRHFRRIAH